MSAGIYNLRIEQNQYYERLFTYLSPSTRVGTVEVPGTPVDLTGYTAVMFVKYRKIESVPALSLTTENGGLQVGAADGTVRLIITSDQTATLTEDAEYDLVLLAPSGERERFLEGNVLLDKTVSWNGN